jgi:uncharacterized membrane protein
MQGTEAEASYLLWVGRGAIAIEALAVVLIVTFIMVATFNWLLRALLSRGFSVEHYERYRGRLGRAMLVGLEILVAADVVRTVALEPTLTNTAALGVLVVIRTFLSWSIVLEVEGRWPWQSRPASAEREKSV